MSHKDQVTLSFAAGLDKEGAKNEIIPKSVEGVNPHGDMGGEKK